MKIIFRAEEKDSKDLVEGLLVLDTVEYCEPDVQHNGYFIQRINPYKGYKKNVRIKYETLEVKFPGNEDFISFHEKMKVV